jgi:hypothetical protein
VSALRTSISTSSVCVVLAVVASLAVKAKNETDVRSNENPRSSEPKDTSPYERERMALGALPMLRSSVLLAGYEMFEKYCQPSEPANLKSWYSSGRAEMPSVLRSSNWWSMLVWVGL